jgi:hypothetical protein
MIWNKILILQKKHENMYERRELMKSYNMEEYKIKCAQFNHDDELCLQQIIDDFLKRMGMVESNF